jgi:hypothetical protein
MHPLEESRQFKRGCYKKSEILEKCEPIPVYPRDSLFGAWSPGFTPAKRHCKRVRAQCKLLVNLVYCRSIDNTVVYTIVYRLYCIGNTLTVVDRFAVKKNRP